MEIFPCQEIAGAGAVPIQPGMGAEQVAGTRGSGCLHRDRGEKSDIKEYLVPVSPRLGLFPLHTDDLKICLSKVPSLPWLSYFTGQGTGNNSRK